MKNNLTYFTVLFLFFILVAFGCLFILNGDTSVFDRSNKLEGTNEAVLGQVVNGYEPDEQEELAYVGVNNARTVVEEEEEPEEAPEEIQEEPEVESEPEEPEQEVHYYQFTTDTRHTILRLREQPDIEAEILAKLSKNTIGFILKPGREWCRVVTVNGQIGYVSTEYIIVDEITEEEFPEEFRSEVEGPDEESGDPFEAKG